MHKSTTANNIKNKELTTLINLYIKEDIYKEAKIIIKLNNYKIIFKRR